MMKIFRIIFIVISAAVISLAQSDTVDQSEMNKSLITKIGISARTYNDSVIIRWGVSTAAAWKICKEFGFILERAPILNDNSYGDFKAVRKEVFEPWTEYQWEKYLGSRNPNRDTSEVDYELFAYMFGAAKEEPKNISTENITRNDIQNIKDNKSKLDWQLLLAMVAANGTPIAAEGLGLRYVDKNVKAGERYVYRIKLAGKSSPYIIQDGIVEVKVQPFDPDFAKQEIFAIENEGSIELKWKSNSLIGSYLIDRSDDNGKNFNRITKVPVLSMKGETELPDSSEGYQDTLVINYNPYIYRIYGTTAFGDKVVLGQIKAMGRDRTPPESPFLTQPEHINYNAVKLTWKMNEVPTKDLKGFYIGRDTSNSGEFKYITNLLPAGTREFIDTAYLRSESNYYLVEAIDTAGNLSQSYTVYAALNDTTPPSKPEWIKGTMDSVGVVTLELKQVKDNDFMGFRILRSNSPEHEFSSLIESFGDEAIDYSLITKFLDTVSIETTTPYVYYRATALDNRYNESQFSEIIAVRRPDIIPPTSPSILDVSVTEKSVTLSFAPSRSLDIKSHTVHKRFSGDKNWQTLTLLGAKDSLYTDTSVTPNVVVEYFVTAMDSTGLISKPSQIVSARPYYTGVLEMVKNLKAVYNIEKKTAELSWDYENLKGIYFEIYRSYGEVQQVYKYIREDGVRSYTDNNLAAGETEFSYSIKVLDELGGESLLSNPVNIDVK